MTPPPGGRGAVLFVHRGALGDFTLSFPLLLSLKKAGYRRVLLTRPGHGALAQSLGLCEGYSDCESRTPPPGPFSRAIAAVAGPAREWARYGCPVHAFFPRPRGDARIHAADYFFDQLKALALPRVPLTGAFWQGGGKVLIHPGSGSPSKHWPGPCYLGLHGALGPDKAEFLLGPAEIERGGDWPGAPVAPEGMVALKDALVRARAVVAHDSGVAHLAAFLGAPTVSIFRSTDPAVWAPRGPRVKVLEMREFDRERVVRAQEDTLALAPFPPLP